jgi:hypothetical protein
MELAQLSDSQREALQTYTSVTAQDLAAAISLLQRSEWNVQVRSSIGCMKTCILIDTRSLLQNSLMAKLRIRSKRHGVFRQLAHHRDYKVNERCYSKDYTAARGLRRLRTGSQLLELYHSLRIVEY